jgi:hypothetical protein
MKNKSGRKQQSPRRIILSGFAITAFAVRVIRKKQEAL